METSEPYQPKQFDLNRLHGISDQTLEMHFKLYEGYVQETNRLTEKIWDFLKDGHVDQEEMPAYSELTRRLGFEYNGMVLHDARRSDRRSPSGRHHGRSLLCDRYGRRLGDLLLVP